MYETIKKEKALLVIVEIEKIRWSKQALAEEFKHLVVSSGIEVDDLIWVKRNKPTPALYIGKGKAEEITLIVQEKDINVVVFNNNLNFTQQRNMEALFGVKTIDRTQLILDIFARHARTKTGSLEVELAQLEYMLPRLRGKGIILSRLGGGIGTRGPGEKKLEVDRRRISDRIVRLKKDLQEVTLHRQVMRNKRQKQNMRVCSLVGYTNAGKSTLFNALTESKERTSPSLFTTLDTVSHILMLHNSLKSLITDTVGFLYELPPNLVEAFKATLEELQYADLLLHVVDVSGVDTQRLMKSVNIILEDLQLDSKPALLVFNKIDQLSSQEVAGLRKDYPQAVVVSALEKTHLDTLREKIYAVLFRDSQEVVLKFPFGRMEVVDYIHKNCEILKIDYQEESVIYWVRAKKPAWEYLERVGVAVKHIEDPKNKP